MLLTPSLTKPLCERRGPAGSLSHREAYMKNHPLRVMRCPLFFAFLSLFLSVSDVIVSNRDHDVITTDFIVMHIFISVSLFFSYKSMKAPLLLSPSSSDEFYFKSFSSKRNTIPFRVLSRRYLLRLLANLFSRTDFIALCVTSPRSNSLSLTSFHPIHTSNI